MQISYLNLTASAISIFNLVSVAEQAGLCLTWTEAQDRFSHHVEAHLILYVVSYLFMLTKLMQGHSRCLKVYTSGNMVNVFMHMIQKQNKCKQQKPSSDATKT